MAKKSSLVDKALEVSRKNRVPKKPVKTKGKKTVPAVLDWGTGIPEDKLAYLNDDEMALVQAKREFKGKRKVNGVPAFADDSASSTGMSRGDTSGTKGSTGAGAGGLGGGNKGSPGNSPGGSPNAGGSKASPSGGQPNSPGGAGGQNATPSGGPGGGSLSAPARTTPSSAPSSPAGFGPRQSNMPGNPVSTAPSTQSWQGALDRIAKGSSVVSNPTGQKPFTDRVPQAAPQAVRYSQAPTVSPNMSGPGNYSSLSSLTSGANSPFADPGVTSYDAEKERDRAIASARTAAQSGILGPSVPAGTAIQRDPYFGAEQVANRYSKPLPSIGVNPNLYSSPVDISRPTTRSIAVSAPGIGVNPNLYSSPVDISRPTTIAQDPSLAGRAASANTLGQRLVNASIGAANTIGDYAGSFFGGSPTMAAASAAINPQTGLPFGEKITDRPPGSEAMPPGDVYKTPGPVSAPVVAPTIGVNPNLYSSPIKIQQPVSPPVDRLVQLSNYAIQRQTPENLSVAFANPNAAWGEFAGMENAMNRVPASSEFNSFGSNLPSEYTGGFNSSPASAPTTSYSGNPFNTGYPSPQTEDIRRAVEIAQESAAPKKQGPINVHGYPAQQADISPSQGDYSPSQAPAYDVSPSQQSGWTSAQRDAYLGSLGNSKTGQVQVSQNGGQPQGSPVVPAAPMTTLAPMPDWVDYSYLYNDYPQLALGATPNIGAFNQYNATFKRGGRVGDSIEAALRLALQGIVSRNKTS